MIRDFVNRLLEGRGRSGPADAAELKIVHASSNDSDNIGVEAWDRDDLVFEMVAECNGARILRIGGRDFDRDSLMALLNRCIEEIDAWEATLREPGAVWENEEIRKP